MNVRSPGKGKGLLVAVETTVNLPRVQWMWATVLLNQQAEGLLFILDGDDQIQMGESATVYMLGQ